MYRYHILDSNGKVVERFKKFSDMISYAIEFRLDDTYKLERIKYVQSKRQLVVKYQVVDSLGNSLTKEYKDRKYAEEFMLSRQGKYAGWRIKEIKY